MTSNSLDIETTGKQDGYALEPWRYPNEGRITSVAICRPDNDVNQIELPPINVLSQDITETIYTLDGEETWVHNGVFDIAWMLNYTSKEALNRVRWKDTMLAAKWMLNGQKLDRNRNFGLDLDNLITTFLKDHPLYEEFHHIKQQDVKPGENPEYWLRRGQLDSILTKALGDFFYSKMPPSIKIGFDIECRCLVPIAESWLRGIRLDLDKTEELQQRVKKAKKNIAKSIDQPEAMFTSPKRLSHFLFSEKGLKPTEFTAKGAPSTGKEVLMNLYYTYNQDKDLKAIMAFKNLATMQSKFLNGVEKCTSHNGRPYSHAAPRLFGTITGRMTYSNKTLGKYFIGLAQHQIPREGPIKELLIAEEGHWIVQFDAAAQELRFIGIVAGEPVIIRMFNEGMDLHADMAANIAGWAYEDMVEKFHAKDTSAYNYRQAGKLTNLSCQYRIGANALAKKFFSIYQIFIDLRTANFYLNTYKRRYVRVVEYWDEAIKKARETGYAESIAGRRYRINDWKRYKWMSESNAINHPIQGSGADHMEVAIAVMNETVPSARLLTVMHDGIYWQIPDEAVAHVMSDILNDIDFESIWQKEIPIPLPFDGEVGKNFKYLKEFTYGG